MNLYYISVVFKNGLATGAVFLEDGKVVKTAPIFYKSLFGKTLDEVKKYVAKFKGIIEKVY